MSNVIKEKKVFVNVKIKGEWKKVIRPVQIIKEYGFTWANVTLSNGKEIQQQYQFDYKVIGPKPELLYHTRLCKHLEEAEFAFAKFMQEYEEVLLGQEKDLLF